VELRSATDGSRNKWAAQPILLIVTADLAGEAGIAGNDSGARPNDEDGINTLIFKSLTPYVHL
jgi:hypothetical protein